jgi:integrase
MGRPYYLHRRGNIWYAELVDMETGAKLTARSTGTAIRDEALLTIAEWLKNGVPTGRKRHPRPVETAIDIENILRAVRKADIVNEDALRIVNILKDRGLLDVSASKSGQGSVLFSEYLESFWDYCSSSYVKDKLAHGQCIHKRHCYEMQSRVRSFYCRYFAGRTLNSITRQDMKDFSMSLREKREKPLNYKGRFAEFLSPEYINRILNAGFTALKYAFNEGHILVDPTAGLKKFSGESKKRGVLTPKEAELIFSIEWKDKRAYVGNLVACTCGLRSGEVLALKKSDIGEKVLHIRHSWSTMDKLKKTKTEESREVPLFPEVKKKLLELLVENPHKMDDPFIFYSLYEDQPFDGKILLKGLYEACADANIDFKARGICFHSHRHYWAARMSDRMEMDKLQRITGHRSKAIFEQYAAHVIDENLEEVGKVGIEVFGNILQFPKAV